jgi:hypothetical protein
VEVGVRPDSERRADLPRKTLPLLGPGLENRVLAAPLISKKKIRHADALSIWIALKKCEKNLSAENGM